MSSWPAIPLAPWADRQLEIIADLTGDRQMAAISGQTLMAERAVINRFALPGRVSSGGGCAIVQARNGTVALNLSRPEDLEMLPALFKVDTVSDVGEHMAKVSAADVVAQGRLLGLAIAQFDEEPPSPACAITALGDVKSARVSEPRVVDLSSLWAGPLAARLLRLSGAQVIKVETANRPDGMRAGDPEFYDRLNEGKGKRSIDLKHELGREELLALIAKADIVIEAARPRALLQLGIDADALVRAQPGLVWVSITGHGILGEAANWIGFGDDCGVAAGLSRALHDMTGNTGFVGDAIADPLTGIYAARRVLELLEMGQGARVVVSMSGVVAKAMDETGTDLVDELRDWAAEC